MRGRRIAAILASLALVTACGSQINPATDGELRVVTTTGILADFVRHVAGDRAHVSQLVPDGADPHSYEPSLRSIRDVAYADLAFSNYLMLEQHSIIRALDANLPAGSTSISIAEEAAKQGATILPLVENRGLDALWLGLRVAGDGAQYGATRASTVDLTVTDVEGPGDASAFITTTFGEPDLAFSSHDGFDPADGYANDTETLPAAAHQHMSWGFTKPGVYRLHVRAALRPASGAKPLNLRESTLVFAVGVDAGKVAQEENRQVISAGHGDVTADLQAMELTVMLDDASVPEGATSGATTSGATTAQGADSPATQGTSSAINTDQTTPATQPAQNGTYAQVPGLTSLSPDAVVLEVPARTLTQVPVGNGYRFLGHTGDPVYLLPQAVLGKHVHGEIDPHLWQDVHNAAAYVRVIRDALIDVDPDGEQEYRANAARYLSELDALDAEVSQVIETIPASRRHLVTTNDAYAYLANAYHMDIAGFVAPNPGVEPSLADRKRLSATLASLDVPAVFLEPNLNQRRSPLVSVAQQAGVQVCSLYGDTLDHQAPTYVDMMRFNAHSLARCLG